MATVPQEATSEQVLGTIREWVDVLAKGDYEAVFRELGYALAFDTPGQAAIRRDIEGYRSEEFYPSVTTFAVTDWRTAKGGNPEPTWKVTWYQPNSPGLAAAVAFDLPLNGKWSDLTADFVLFHDTASGYTLGLEGIESNSQRQREIDAI
jgi:hypothetical protein